jgi:hypothetical protein
MLRHALPAGTVLLTLLSLASCGGEPRQPDIATGSGAGGAGDTAAPARDTAGARAAARRSASGAGDQIEDAMEAAPEEIARNATIMAWPDTAGGKPKQLRAGTNGWVCFASSPGAVTAAGEDPMCLDKEFQAWAAAWSSKQKPRVKGMAIAYMLRGDAGVSNTDPFATKETPDNQWVKSGPHVMVATPSPAALAGFPTDPKNGGPWVMWKGTPYAHLMVPVEDDD